MAKLKNTNKRRKRQQRQKSSKYENKGFTFTFEDTNLQDQYVKVWEHYNTILPAFPKPKNVAWVDAKSLTQGKNAKDLAIIENVYERTSDLKRDVKADKHKYASFQEYVDESNEKTINNYIKQVYKFFEEVEKTTGSKILNAGDTRYNILYYINNPDG